MEGIQRISEWPILGKVSAHGHGFGGFTGFNSQWSDVVVGLELNYTHGKFGGSQTDSMSRFFTLPSGYTDGVTYEGTARINITDMGTLRVRGGYACGSFLPYMFAGIALGQADIIRTARVFGTQVNPLAAPGFQNVIRSSRSRTKQGTASMRSALCCSSEDCFAASLSAAWRSGPAAIRLASAV